MESNTTEIILEVFTQPKHKWKVVNDPVMGGKSYSNLSINSNNNGLAIFEGEVVDVPFLQSPGFISIRGDGNYPDVSMCKSLLLTARSIIPYSGYRISFGSKHVPGNRFAFGFKANVDLKSSEEILVPIEIPFYNFTVRWNDATGDPIVTCQEDKRFCPDVKTLQDMKTISIWGEGVSGKVQLEIESIKAIHCDEEGLGKGISQDFDGGLNYYHLWMSSNIHVVFFAILSMIGIVLFTRKIVPSQRKSYIILGSNSEISMV